MSRWFRVYDSLVDDPKVQLLSAENFRGLVNLWCLACRNEGCLPPMEDIAFSLRTTVPKTEKLISDLTAAGLIDTDATVTRPHNWTGRQFKSDVTDNTNAERQRRYRERHAVTDKTVTPPVTPPVTPDVTAKRPDTESESEKDKSESSSERDSSFPSVAPAQASGAVRLKLVAEELEIAPDLPAVADRREYPDDFEYLWAEYRPIASPNSTKADAHKAWAKLSAANRQACLRGLVLYVVWVGEENARNAATKRDPISVKHLATFINRRGWEPFLEEAQRVAG